MEAGANLSMWYREHIGADRFRAPISSLELCEWHSNQTMAMSSSTIVQSESPENEAKVHCIDRSTRGQLFTCSLSVMCH